MSLLLLAQAAAGAPPAPDYSHPFFEAVLPAVLTAVGAAVTWAMAVLASWLHKKAEASKVALVAERFWALAQTVVAHVEVELRPKLALALADGRLTKEEAQRLKSEAVRLLKEAAGNEGMQEFRNVMGLTGGAVDVFLSGLVERALGTQRAARTLPPPPAPSSARTVVATGTRMATPTPTGNPPRP